MKFAFEKNDLSEIALSPPEDQNSPARQRFGLPLKDRHAFRG
jgi:hypothetical protein